MGGLRGCARTGDAGSSACRGGATISSDAGGGEFGTGGAVASGSRSFAVVSDWLPTVTALTPCDRSRDGRSSHAARPMASTHTAGTAT